MFEVDFFNTFGYYTDEQIVVHNTILDITSKPKQSKNIAYEWCISVRNLIDRDQYAVTYIKDTCT